MKIELSQKDVEFLLAALDRVQVQGVETAFQLIEIVKKLKYEQTKGDQGR